MFSGARSRELWDVYPNLIDEDADHEEKIDAKGKQQEYFGRCEVPARKRPSLGCDKLIRLQRCHNVCVEIGRRRSVAILRRWNRLFHKWPAKATNTLGAITLIPKSTPALVNRTTTAAVSRLAHRGLTRSPMISLSFAKRNRNARAGGIASTATTLTVITTYTSG